jgi:hypothetical protein
MTSRRGAPEESETSAMHAVTKPTLCLVASGSLTVTDALCAGPIAPLEGWAWRIFSPPKTPEFCRKKPRPEFVPQPLP